ncbi:S46 family peptidase [Pontibacter sp. BT310]|uniref:Dipeptidyl-peptidase n=1 Tax=Pontibacter populi TaxID=890055 RepID=A0ABS6XF32_9BACT|nr:MULTISPECIES: S46 family peptidase [Pontibacter]MBJ6119746.1 S46 family peptidase [Pontibacter sp. BT310]MBR0572175.1 S46 family peptidase [Microvirga sp. STS03]MBW3366599.1 S46 family peptidase [Pontibacter populi]
MISKRIFAFIAAVWLSIGISSARPDEGMWLPMLLKQLNESDMQKKGLKLSADDIYSVNQSSLKDAIVSFGGFCTGEMISSEGLLLTNHHCGYGQIQQHSSVENDYLTKGFWAMTKEQELPNPGLTATFIVRMEDVTKQILAGANAAKSEAEREAIIQKNIAKVAKESTAGTHYDAVIKPYFYGNEYYMYITETYKDIRMVGAPPSSIGKFGGDTDNWMWPRHTGDFSLFRIYAGPNNEPAEYSPNNKPYKPKHHLPISLSGVKENDFTLVFGFPGRTNEYLTSHAIEDIYEVSNPAKINIRDTKLQILDKDMKASDAVRIQYAAKYASIANYWKKWTGENRGLKKANAIEKKQELERQFMSWVNADPTRKQEYGNLMTEFEKNYKALDGITISRDYIMEAANGVELIRYASGFGKLQEMIAAKAPQAEINAQVERLENGAAGFFKNYNAPTDKKVFVALMGMYYNDLDKKLLPEAVRTAGAKTKGDFTKLADEIYSKSRLTSEAGVKKLLADVKAGKTDVLQKDPAFALSNAIDMHYRTQVLPTYTAVNDNLNLLYRKYITGLRAMQQDKKFYPDANSTLRVAYGKVEPYEPLDGVTYNYYTTLEGIMEKAAMTGVEDYVIPEKLRELYEKKDYGPYGMNGEMPVGFIASNHTTGGNSGSPVINANGQLIGTNFDRNWEGTMSDIAYNPDQVRNIAVDARYMLFIVDKFAGAGHLVKEMTLVTDNTSGLPQVDARKTAEPTKELSKKEKRKLEKAAKKKKKEAAEVN